MLTTSGIIETALYVEDMQRSVEFYQRVFHFSTLFASERLTALRVAPGSGSSRHEEGRIVESKCHVIWRDPVE